MRRQGCRHFRLTEICFFCVQPGCFGDLPAGDPAGDGACAARNGGPAPDVFVLTGGRALYSVWLFEIDLYSLERRSADISGRDRGGRQRRGAERPEICGGICLPRGKVGWRVILFHARNRRASCLRGLPEAPDRGTGESGFASGSSGSSDLRLTLRERFSSGGARVRRTPPLYRLRTTAFSSFRMRGTGAQAAFAGCRPRRAEAEIQNRAGRRRESR